MCEEPPKMIRFGHLLSSFCPKQAVPTVSAARERRQGETRQRPSRMQLRYAGTPTILHGEQEQLPTVESIKAYDDSVVAPISDCVPSVAPSCSSRGHGLAPLAVTEEAGDQAVQPSFPSISVSVPDWLATLSSIQTTEQRPKHEEDQDQERAKTDAEPPKIESFEMEERKGQTPKASEPTLSDVNYPLKSLFTDMLNEHKRVASEESAQQRHESVPQSSLASMASAPSMGTQETGVFERPRGIMKAVKSNAASIGESTLISYADIVAGRRIPVQERQDEPILSEMR